MKHKTDSNKQNKHRESKKKKLLSSINLFTKMEEIQNGISNRQTEAEDYLKKHKINELFVNITASLVFKKPGWLLVECFSF